MRSNAEESRLARAAAAGDGQAFAQLYDRYEKPIYNYCLRLLGNEHDAQDATQDSFVKFMRRLPELGDRELEVGAYLYRIARNASYDMIGKRKRTEPVEEFAEEAVDPFGDGPALDEDPVRSALHRAEVDSIRAANARLPARQREVLALRELQGMSYEDIADLLEMNANSVAQLISRARIRLRKELRGEAAAAIAPSGPDCERALPLLAKRQDGKLDEGAEGDWLDGHLATCVSCPLAAEAMAEAGVSYRAWAPVVPAAWLFRDTIAEAAEAVGADWSDVRRPGDAGAGDTGAGGSDAGGKGAGSSGAGGAGAGAAGLPPADEAAGRRRRRGLLVGALGAALLLLTFGGLAAGVFGGETENPPPDTTTAREPESTPTAATTPEKQEAQAKKPQRAKKPKPKPAPEPEPAPVPTVAATPTEPSPEAQPTSEPPPEPRDRGRKRPAGGTGSWGDSTRPEKDPPPPPQPEPTTPEPPPAETPTDPPPTTEPTGPTGPTGGPNDPKCASRVC